MAAHSSFSFALPSRRKPRWARDRAGLANKLRGVRYTSKCSDRLAPGARRARHAMRSTAGFHKKIRDKARLVATPNFSPLERIIRKEPRQIVAMVSESGFFCEGLSHVLRRRQRASHRHRS